MENIGGKTFWMSAAASIFIIVFSQVCIAYVNDKLPDRQKYPPLPDIFLDNIKYVPAASKVVDICMFSIIFIMVGVLFFHKWRFVVLRRIFVLCTAMYFLRCIIILVTSIPVPDVHKKCNVHPESSIWSTITRSLSVGIQALGAQSCGDYIFSGHTGFLTMLNLFVIEYSPGITLLHCVSCMVHIVGITSILLCRGHYTVDILLAFYISAHLFSYYHTLICDRTVLMKQKKRAWLYFPIFLFLDDEINSIFSNEYEWPFPKIKKCVKPVLQPFEENVKIHIV